MSALNSFQPIDFFARRAHFVDHLAPVWHALPMDARGLFHAPASLSDYVAGLGIEINPLRPARKFEPLEVIPTGAGPILSCAYGDMRMAMKGAKRKHILMEHGVGLTFHHPAYAGGKGSRELASFFLAPNSLVAGKTARAIAGARQKVVGTPKMDKYMPPSPALPPNAEERIQGKGAKEKPVVCIAFHWDGSQVAPEAGNAWRHYQGVLSSLAHESGFTLIGHGHPRAIDEFAKVYEKLGIEVVRSFDDVMQRADVYVNDCSSTMYEFCVTGKAVVILNAPQFRKYVSFGLRFWDYADVGPQVEGPDGLLRAIERVLVAPEIYEEARMQAVADLYPFLGQSAVRAAGALSSFVNGGCDDYAG